MEQRINSEVQIKVLIEPMNNPLGVSPSKGNQGTSRGGEKDLLTSVGIEPTTSGLDLPLLVLLCRLRYEVGQRKSGTINGFNHFNLHVRVNSLFHHRPFIVLRGTTFICFPSRLVKLLVI